MSKAESAHRKQKWVEEMIVNGGNQTKAAIAVGVKRSAAEKAGQRYAKDPECKRLLEEARARALRESMLTANESVQSLARDVKFNPRNLLLAIGTPKNIVDKIDDDTMVAIRGIKVDPVEVGKGKRKKIAYRVEVKFPEKTAAREQAMKHFGLYERDNKQKPFYTPPALIIEGVKGKGR